MQPLQPLGIARADEGPLRERNEAIVLDRQGEIDEILVIGEDGHHLPAELVCLDELFGGDGDDQLTGGNGQDTMDGGDGADAFIFNTADEIQFDIIQNFEMYSSPSVPFDRINLSAIDPGSSDGAFHRVDTVDELNAEYGAIYGRVINGGADVRLELNVNGTLKYIILENRGAGFDIDNVAFVL